MPHHLNLESSFELASRSDVASMLARLSDPRSGRRRLERHDQRLATTALKALFPVMTAGPHRPQGVLSPRPRRELQTTAYEQEPVQETSPKEVTGAIRGRRCECGVC